MCHMERTSTPFIAASQYNIAPSDQEWGNNRRRNTPHRITPTHAKHARSLYYTLFSTYTATLTVANEKTGVKRKFTPLGWTEGGNQTYTAYSVFCYMVDWKKLLGGKSLAWVRFRPPVIVDLWRSFELMPSSPSFFRRQRERTCSSARFETEKYVAMRCCRTWRRPGRKIPSHSGVCLDATFVIGTEEEEE